ncbi:MAG TPA: phosphotransferase [Candidatus Krumholzibacteria bacterium]|nr:phosphotransferase [Candidatus Krumholzibacteria bacterium]
MARDMVEIITTDLSEQPAVRAWRSLRFAADGFVPAVPLRLEMLRRRDKSIVYRLVGVGRSGGDVIAKLACRSSANVERDVYLVLRRLPIVSTEFYGMVEAIGGRAGVEACGLVAESQLSSPAPNGQAGGPDQRVSSPQFDHSASDANGEFSWLFLGDAEGTPFDSSDAGQREIATRWLAALHTSSSALADASRLPARGPAHYLGHLHGAQAVIQRIRGNPIFSVADHTTLDEVQAWLDHAESRWPDIVACCHEVPWALVHGDFAARNVRVRGSDATARLLAFDWEVAGWGMPTVDLRDMDLDLYHALVAPHWPQLRIETLRQAARVGDLLRGCLAAVHWEALKCEGKGVHATMDNMRIFEQRFGTVFRDLGWLQGVACRESRQ